MIKFLVRVLNKLKLLRFINIVVKEGNVNIPILGGMGYSSLLGTERWMNTLLEVLLKKSNGCLVDVGVNLGQTLIKIKRIDPEFDYIGFEPNPVCVFYSERLVALNQFPNTVIVPVGVAKDNAIVTLKYFSADITDSSATIVDNFRPDQKVFQEKKIIVLNDDMIRLNKKTGIIKIDVEGAELYVLEGLKRHIKQDRPFIAIEILPVYKAENIERIDRQYAIEQMLLELNYIIFKIMKKSDDTFSALEKIKEIGIHSDITHCDYLFVPGERVMEIEKEFAR